MHFPGGTLKLAEHTDPPTHKELNWNVVEEPLEGQDDFKHIILAHILSGKSCFISGGPGTGKSWMLKQVEEAIGDCRRLAPTHATARLIQGGTIHTFVARQAASFQGTILIDEISMVQLPLLAALDRLRADGKCRIICFGDFRQLPPVGNSWRGTGVEPSIFQNSRLFKLWCDSTMFTLRRCRRCDPVHFNFLHESTRQSTGCDQNMQEKLSEHA